MPKRTIDYPIHLNMLVADDGTKEELIAISYFRNGSDEFGPVVRDFIQDGLIRFRASLSERDKARFREILENVKLTRSMRGQTSSQKG